MRALLIEFNPYTGVRAGGVSPKDKNLVCHGWQNLDSNPALEVRLVLDDRDLTKYKDVAGVTILNSKEEINEAINKHIPPAYIITDMTLALAHVSNKKLNLDSLAGKNRNEIAKIFADNKIAGVIEKKPKLVDE